MKDLSHATSHIDQCRVIELSKHHHENGNLTVVENMAQIPY